MVKSVSRFLNVDLLVTSAHDLKHVAEALGRAVEVLHRDKLGRKYWMLLELAVTPRTPTHAIRAFAKLSAKLRGRARTTWRQAEKEFDVGVQLGAQREPAEWVVDADAVALASQLGARLRFTAYSVNNAS